MAVHHLRFEEDILVNFLTHRAERQCVDRRGHFTNGVGKGLRGILLGRFGALQRGALRLGRLHLAARYWVNLGICPMPEDSLFSPAASDSGSPFLAPIRLRIFLGRSASFFHSNLSLSGAPTGS